MAEQSDRVRRHEMARLIGTVRPQGYLWEQYISITCRYSKLNHYWAMLRALLSSQLCLARLF
jgi:hypothetical protein